jgi:hypothetical protein
MSNVETLVATWRKEAAEADERVVGMSYSPHSCELKGGVKARRSLADALESALAADRRAEDRGGVPLTSIRALAGYVEDTAAAGDVLAHWCIVADWLDSTPTPEASHE